MPLILGLSPPISLHNKLRNFCIKLVSHVNMYVSFCRTRCLIYLSTSWSWVLKHTCSHLNGSWLCSRPSSRYLWCFTSSTSFCRRWVNWPHLSIRLSVCLSVRPSVHPSVRHPVCVPLFTTKFPVFMVFHILDFFLSEVSKFTISVCPSVRLSDDVHDQVPVRERS